MGANARATLDLDHLCLAFVGTLGCTSIDPGPSATREATTAIVVGLRWERPDGASGDLYDAVYADPIEPGGNIELDKADTMPGPGSYTVTATLDKKGDVDELNETNNDISIQLTVE